MKKIVIVFSLMLFCLNLSACDFTQSHVSLSDKEKEYIQQLKKEGRALDCMPKIGTVDPIVESLCRKASIENIGIDVAY